MKIVRFTKRKTKLPTLQCLWCGHRFGTAGLKAHQDTCRKKPYDDIKGL